LLKGKEGVDVEEWRRLICKEQFESLDPFRGSKDGVGRSRFLRKQEMWSTLLI
jgi:hypothetical protein